MKTTQPRQRRRNPLHQLIQAATCAPDQDLTLIENIMREDVFHSTLDWQSEQQLADGARQAFARLQDDRHLYNLDQECRMAMFHKMRAEAEVRNQDTAANRSALATAENHYEEARERLLGHCTTA